MKKILIVLMLTALFNSVFSQEPSNFQRASVVSPEIGESMAILRLQLPSASEVKLSGPKMWQDVAMTKGENGLWSINVKCLTIELYTYNSDSLIESATQLDVTLSRNEIGHTYYVNQGGHIWSNLGIYHNSFISLQSELLWPIGRR